jgi:hypothetical protein
MDDAVSEFLDRQKRRKLLGAVVNEARRHGLKCELLPSDTPGSYRFCKRLLIEEQKCQVVPCRVKRGSSGTFYPLYLPTTHWADFLVYAIRHNVEPEKFSFFVIPRGEIVKSTVLCSPDNPLLKYQDAWRLLSEKLPAARLARRPEIFNWKITFAMKRVPDLGFELKLVKQVGKNRHLQNLILINDRRCQTLALARLSADTKTERWNYVTLHASKQEWTEFLIFLLRTTGSDHVRTFVVPRERIPRTTTTSLASGWLSEYEDNWSQLGERIEAVIPSSPGVDHETS